MKQKDLVGLRVADMTPEESHIVQQWFFERGVYWKDSGNKLMGYSCVSCCNRTETHGRIVLMADRQRGPMTFSEFRDRYMLFDAFERMKEM